VKIFNPKIPRYLPFILQKCTLRYLVKVHHLDSGTVIDRVNVKKEMFERYKRNYQKPKRDEGQTIQWLNERDEEQIVHKTTHRKHKFEQHEPYNKLKRECK